MVGKRHASEEIAAKLAHADELAAKGKTQREISKALGVSIMTYHRWRKTLNIGPGSAEDTEPGTSAGRLETSDPRDVDETIKQLEQENVRLRRLVTDMLLEKLKLEDEIRARQTARYRRPDNGK